MIFSEELKNKFRSTISSRGGLYFKDHDMKNLENAILLRSKEKGFDSVSSYYIHLTQSEGREDEFRELLNILTINHTYFFRNEPHFKVLQEKILPEIIQRELIKKKENGPDYKPTIRIWSAGCSTGEEPYTISMVIQDMIPNLDEWDIQIVATDASQEALAGARQGKYRPSSMKLVDQSHKEQYFTKKNNEQKLYSINESVKNLVSLGFYNLMDEDYPISFDIIFCRNVTIYFDLETTIKVMSKFHKSLLEDGYLFIGYSESLQFMRDKYVMENFDEAIFYRRADKELVVGESTAQLEEQEKSLDEVLDEISMAEIEATSLKAPDRSVSKEKFDDTLLQAVKLFHLKNYEQALNYANDASDLDPESLNSHYLAAEILVNMGDLNQAKERLSKVLKLDSLFAPGHYLLGCIGNEEGSLTEAKERFKKSLFIDKDFLVARYHLANIYKDENQLTEAIREYRNTLKALSSNSLEDIIAYSGGFNTATLMSACRDNLERLKEEV